MKHVLILTMSLLVALGGCGSTPQPSPTPGQPNAKSDPTQQTRAPSKTSAIPLGAVNSDVPAIPVDAKYTIICTRFAEGGHVQQARRAKETLVRATGRNEFYVVHEEGESALFFGYYKEIDHLINPAEAQRAEKDLTYLRSLRDTAGNKIFPGCLKQPMPVPDPDGPPEYDLSRIDLDKSPDDPTRRYWSIAIAAYTVDAQGQGVDAGKNRKQLALECVLDARKAGVEAYYYHGDTASMVCVGAWPRSAVREQEASDAESKSDNGQDIVVSATPLPQNIRDQFEKSGHDVKIFEPRIEVEDQTLIQVAKNFPNYSVNGSVKTNHITDPKTGQDTVQKQDSFVVVIPRQQASLLRAEAEPAPAAAPGQINPLNPTATGGRLRSIGQ